MASIRGTCKRVFGYEPKPIQYEVVRAWKKLRSTFAVLPTGYGKTLCFMLPAALLGHGEIAVVFSPLIALIKDQVERAQKVGIKAAAIASDRDDSENREVMRNIQRGNVQLLFVAPERMKNKQFMEVIQRCKVKLIAIDEAHVMARWGKDFRPSYSDIRRFVRLFPGTPVMALTATADKDVETEVALAIGMAGYKRIVASPRRPNLRYQAVFELPEERIPQLVRNAGEGAKVIYCSSRKECDRIAILLRSYRMRAESYHAGLNSAERTETQDKFMANKLDVVVATNAFGMGVDKADIRLVIHWHIPGSIFDYVQEAGRAGRDGLPSLCILNVSKKGRQLRDHFVRNGNPEMETYEHIWSYINEKISVGEVLKTTEQMICRAAHLPDALKGKAMAALRFMEYNRLLATKPGKRIYSLRIRDFNRALRWERTLNDAEIRNGSLTFRIDVDEDDPTSDIVASGACWPGEPTSEIIVKRLRREMSVTEDDIDEKMGHDMNKVRTLLNFAKIADSKKPDFIDQQFLS